MTTLSSCCQPNPEISVTLPTAPLPNIKVLLVEDCEDNMILILEILRRTGATVQTACNGLEGLNLALSGDFDLVLMDIQMPVMDGFKATSELRRHGYQKPIVALTAYALRNERARCLANGFDEHLTKPINRHHLVQSLQDILQPTIKAVH